MAKSKKNVKKEALTTRLFITEILEKELNIPTRNIVNDTTFSQYTGSQRPDLLISTIPYDTKNFNDVDFIKNLAAYAEIKDPSCSVGDKDWLDAINQGKEKSKKLNISYYIVTNLKTSYYYNSETNEELSLNGNPIREFLSLDLLKFIKNQLIKNPKIKDIITNNDTSSIISEDIFNKKLWELANIYREISFNNSSEKIDFTIGFIVLKYFEEKVITLKEKRNDKMIYWSGIKQHLNTQLFIDILSREFEELKKDAQFKEMSKIIDTVLLIIKAQEQKTSIYINEKNIIEIFNVVDNMGKLHSSGFDLFGSVYEKFASNEEKKAFGEFFTRRHYTHIFTKLLFKDKLDSLDESTNWKILDPACGTGGFLTEVFKVLHRSVTSKYLTNNNTTQIDLDSKKIRESIIDKLRKEFIFGYDVKEENIARTKLNMFLVGDGHTNIEKKNSLKDIKVFDYVIKELDNGKKKEEKTLLMKESDKFNFIITNPPYGSGTELAETNSSNTTRFEIAFIFKIIHVLKVNGEACLIIPDGFFENPSYGKLRKEMLEMCEVKAIISLPKHAFAPYTLEKTYAMYIKKKNANNTSIKQEKVWMYIIDNDGFANSNKRFPTKLKDKKTGCWLHDEISSYIDVNSEEQNGLLEQRWLSYNDENTLTEYINEVGEKVNIRKAGFISVNNENGINEKNYWNLLPEYYLRPFEPHYIQFEDFENEVKKLMEEL